MPTQRKGLRRLSLAAPIRKALADGEWHYLAEIVLACVPMIPIEYAVRVHREHRDGHARRRGRPEPTSRLSLEQEIDAGRRIKVSQSLHIMWRVGLIERVPAPEAGRRKAKYRLGRDRKAGGIPTGYRYNKQPQPKEGVCNHVGES